MIKIKMVGRSMIEMLGVLAIIGVLSAGGVWGYNQAMMNHKVNKFIEDYNTMLANAVNVFGNTRQKVSFSASTIIYENSLCQMGVISTSYCKTMAATEVSLEGSNSGYFLDSPFGDKMIVRTVPFLSEHTWSGKFKIKNSLYFSVIVRQVPKQACVRILTHNWNSSSGFFTVVYKYSGTIVRTIKPLTVAEAETQCQGNYKGQYGIVINISSYVGGQVEYL